MAAQRIAKTAFPSFNACLRRGSTVPFVCKISSPISFHRSKSHLATQNCSSFKLLDPSCAIEEECIPGYKAEEFYPAHIGEVFAQRYQAVGKLGCGSSSTVWLCRDLSSKSKPEPIYAALKIYTTRAKLNRELEIYKHLNSVVSNHGGQKAVRKLLESFEITGPHGDHTILVHEPLGMSFYDFKLILPEKSLNKNLLQPTARQVLGALHYLHTEANIIHTDLQANNILLGVKEPSVFSKYEQDEASKPVARKVLPDRTIYVSRPLPITTGLPVLCDLGEARLGTQRNNEDIMPGPYRAPEVILGMDWDHKVDIWNLAMVVWELFEPGRLLGGKNPDGKLDDAYHLAQIISLLGPPPLEFLQRSDRSLIFWDEDGNWRGLAPIPESRSLDGLEQRLEGEDKRGFVEWMDKMLRWMPEDRGTAEETLMNQWLLEGLYPKSRLEMKK